MTSPVILKIAFYGIIFHRILLKYFTISSTPISTSYYLSRASIFLEQPTLFLLSVSPLHQSKIVNFTAARYGSFDLPNAVTCYLLVIDSITSDDLLMPSLFHFDLPRCSKERLFCNSQRLSTVLCV